MTTPTRTSSRPKRGEGQWALGYREPLNPNERMKKDSDGLEVRQRIIDIYSKNGYEKRARPAIVHGRDARAAEPCPASGKPLRFCRDPR